MAEDKPSGTASGAQWDNPTHQLYLHHSDQPGAILVPQPLVEDNYSTWKQSMTMALTVKNKIGLVDDLAARVDVERHRWQRDQLQKRQADVNVVQLFNIENEIHDCVQGVKELAAYLDTQKTMKFLMSLNDSYASVRSNTLLQDPLPTVNKAYSLVLRHEKQSEVTAGKASTQPDVAVFAVKNANRESEGEKGELKCTKCNKTNHTAKNCRAHLKCAFCGWKGHTA
ncbi:unnamed protein product [Malus baccata var. baccata]